ERGLDPAEAAVVTAPVMVLDSGLVDPLVGGDVVVVDLEEHRERVPDRTHPLIWAALVRAGHEVDRGRPATAARTGSLMARDRAEPRNRQHRRVALQRLGQLLVEGLPDLRDLL